MLTFKSRGIIIKMSGHKDGNVVIFTTTHSYEHRMTSVSSTGYQTCDPKFIRKVKTLNGFWYLVDMSYYISKQWLFYSMKISTIYGLTFCTEIPDIFY